MISTNAILLLYHHPFSSNAPTIKEHLRSFNKYSGFTFIEVNINHGFPSRLKNINFPVVVMHYSIFGSFPFLLSSEFISYLSASKAKKVYFFQDEMQYVQERFKLMHDLGVDIIYTLLPPQCYDHYLNNTGASIVRSTLTGYVCDDLIKISSRNHIPFESRSIDVGYRARNLPYHYGRGAYEKSNIADRFLEHMSESNLHLDISTREQDRVYGNDWYSFISNCKFMLGTMAGTSIFDFTGEVQRKVENYLQLHPSASFEHVEEKVLMPYENNLAYRTISPRLFECAAFRVCMILYEGDYQGILQPNIHYISLKRDFSNIDEVLSKT